MKFAANEVIIVFPFPFWTSVCRIIRRSSLEGIGRTTVVGVVDPNPERARNLANILGGVAAFGSVEQALQQTVFDCAHVLVPPHLHAPVAMPLLAAGKHVLVEKPIATTSEEVQSLYAKAGEHNAVLSVNHNVCFLPVVRRFYETLQSCNLGDIRHIAVQWQRPLQHLYVAPPSATWMLQSSRNLVLEAAVHPLSIIAGLGGTVHSVTATPFRRHTFPNGHTICTEWELAATFDRMSATLRYAMGTTYDHTAIEAFLSEGRVYADIARGIVTVDQYSTSKGSIDTLKHAGGAGAQAAWQAASQSRREYADAFGLGPTADAFQISMGRSIQAFYDSLGRNAPHISPTDAATTIQICEAVPLDDMIPRDTKPAAGSDGRPEFDEPSEECDLSILGGSGYIATAIARAALAKGLKVRVLARNPASISESLRRQGVELVVGDIRDDTALALAFRGARARRCRRVGRRYRFAGVFWHYRVDEHARLSHNYRHNTNRSEHS